MSTTEEFIKAAKIRGLNSEETNFILESAYTLDLDPIRVLVNKEFFQNIERHAPIGKKSLVRNIKEKLNFLSTLANRLQSTYDIKEGQRAKFVIDTFINIPIRLHKIEENYLLWEALPHRDTTRIQEGEKGDIIFEERFLIAYRFTTQIAQTFKYKNELLFKIPHSSNLQLLAKRKYPRVDVDIEGVVRKVGKLRSNPFYKCQICNISEGGVKICLPSAPFKEKDRLILRFKINYENIETESNVESEITYNGKESYGLKFIELDDHTRFIIRKYVESKMNQQR